MQCSLRRFCKGDLEVGCAEFVYRRSSFPAVSKLFAMLPFVQEFVFRFVNVRVIRLQLNEQGRRIGDCKFCRISKNWSGGTLTSRH